MRSYGSNLAVNVWWKHHMADHLNFDRCNNPCDLEFTLAEAEFGGFEQMTLDPEDVRSVVIFFSEISDWEHCLYVKTYLFHLK